MVVANDSAPVAPEETSDGSNAPQPVDPELINRELIARFQPRWVIYNMFNIWAYILALGLGWGFSWLLGSFGIDVVGFITGVLDWKALGWGWTVLIGVIAVGAFGAVGLGVNYFIEYWNFELTRVPGEKGTLLRTRQGLFTTREVNRDGNRMRGMQISEPVLWRWLGVSDTTVITTGLSMWSMSQPAAILPRAPVVVARRVAGAVLDVEPNPFELALHRHKRAALRRRLWWACVATGGVALALMWLAATNVTPTWTIWTVAALWPMLLLAAGIAYRALGHAVSGMYLVVRSGLVSRATTALQRSAVSTIAIRESILQRRLGLRTVSAMTAAGYGAYEAPDLDAAEALHFADQAAPGLLAPFIVRDHDES